jgi:hypothetical protein
MTTIDVPQSAQTAFQGNMNTRETIELPFAAPPFYIVNGDAKLVSLKNYQYFGGWAGNADKIKEAADTWEGVPYPIPGLQASETILDDNTALQVLASRSLIVAPIGIRQFSVMKVDGREKRVAPFTKGAAPRIQAIVLLGYHNENKQIVPWAPVMLTAKGFQVNHVQKAFEDWHKAIKPHVKNLVPGVDPASIVNLFWMYIGTFGNERKQDTVGTGSTTKTITPVSAFIPTDLDEQKVSNMYVGSETAEFMVEYSSKSQEWLKAYHNITPAKATASDAPLDVDQTPPPYDEEIPF